MSLLRLLTTGKSLEGLKDSEIRYRVTSQRLLPKFGSAKNPFCAPDKSKPARQLACKAAEAASAPPQQGAAGVAAAAHPAALVRPNRAGMTGALRSRAAELRNKWVGTLSGLLSRPGSKPVKLAMSRPPKLPVQGELSLDKIRVVRNDLSDADLEVVPAKRAAAPEGVRPVLPAAEKTAGGGKAWGRLSGCFRAGKT
jgi:hypothetical protein